MAELVPLKAVYDGSSICGLSELRDGDVVGVEHGGLGVCTLASNTLLIGNGQGAISTTSAMTTNGQIIIAGSSGPQLANLTGTSNEIEITDGDAAITIGLPSTVQISTNLKTPAFSITNEYCLPTADGSAGQIMCTDGSGALSFIDFDGSGHCIAYCGTTVADRTCLNFIGGGVTVSDNSGTNATDVTIPVTTPELKVRNTAGCELSIELENTAIGGELVCDTTPQLGGTLDVNGYGITSVSNGNISITPNGSGSLVLDGLSWPQADGSAGQIMCTDGSGALAFSTASAGVTLAGSTNNTIATVTGSDALCGEGNLIFDGTRLGVNNTSPSTVDGNTDVIVVGDGSSNADVILYSPTDGNGVLGWTDSADTTNQGYIQYLHDGDSMVFGTNNTEALRINDEGVLGIKTTPTSGWHTDHGVLQVGTGALWVDPHDESAASNMVFLSNNLYRDSADEWRAIVTDEITRYYQYNGEHYFDTSAVTTAGAAMSGNSTKLKINNDGDIEVGNTGNTHTGNLGAGGDVFVTVGTASGGGSVELARGTDTDATWIGGLHFANTNNSSTGNDANSKGIASVIGEVETTDSNAGDDSGGHLVFYAKPEAGSIAERMRIASDGKVSLNNNGMYFDYIGYMVPTTTWANIPGPTYISERAGFIHYVSFNNHNGATSGRSYGVVWVSGNGEGSTTYFRYAITPIASNSSGYHGYANLSFRINPDNTKKIQVQRSSNSQNTSGAYFWYQSMGNGGAL